MADLSKLPKDFYVTSMQFTKNAHQDAYPAIDPSIPEHSLAGKVAVITGASRGIGAMAMVPAFVKAGVKGVVLLASNAEKLAATEKSVKETNPNIETLTYALDISDTKGVEAAFEAIRQKFGHADVLVNAAGAMTGDGPKLHDTDPDQWWRNFEINGKGNYLLIRSFLRLLPSPDTPATIVNVSSWQAFFTVPPLGAYFMSKFILDALATYVAAEYPNVTAVSMHPGLVATDMLREPFRSLFNQDSPELVGGTAVWLCQEKAKFLSGRFIAANWDVEDLLSRKEEIVKDDLLKLTLKGDFGV
ncbi:short-chain dehydrogenase/reductase-like protein [Alternaria rosae]|uniref:short-chain dehydrogenase/reductase-like protein n=1 Tax=Alternaria rosae TaxID=1187941 RepID=UPI001E8D4B3C|nr:short-chain dehydrogenase/reductase-like protein [Alternaria rosae]KAH6859099.1 short-chain dehydrogenase/reductase-like protein [Alternaria rosae]